MQPHRRVVPDSAIKNDPQCCFLLTFPPNAVYFVLFRAEGGTNVSDTKNIFKAALKRFGFYSSRTSAERWGWDWNVILCIWMDVVESPTLLAGYIRIVYFASEKHHGAEGKRPSHDGAKQERLLTRCNIEHKSEKGKKTTTSASE